MKFDKLQYALDRSADFVTVLSEDNGISAEELYNSLKTALEDEIEWHQVAVERLEGFKQLIDV